MDSTVEMNYAQCEEISFISFLLLLSFYYYCFNRLGEECLFNFKVPGKLHKKALISWK